MYEHTHTHTPAMSGRGDESVFWTFVCQRHKTTTQFVPNFFLKIAEWHKFFVTGVLARATSLCFWHLCVNMCVCVIICASANVFRRGCLWCLIFTSHFPQKSPINSGSFAERDLQLTASVCRSVCVSYGVAAVSRIDKIYWSLLQNIVSFIGLFCKRDL